MTVDIDLQSICTVLLLTVDVYLQSVCTVVLLTVDVDLQSVCIVLLLTVDVDLQSVCTVVLFQLCQRSLNQSGQAVWEASLWNCPPLQNLAVPYGQLFAFDPPGSYVLTCGLTGGTIYQVRAYRQEGALCVTCDIA